MKEEIPESFWEALFGFRDQDLEEARELFQTAMELAKKYKDERDEAREALRAVYSAGCELKRHVTACVMNYREVASPSAVETLEQFHNASRDLARIVGEEAAK